ncbi:MAG: DUF2993 domain-containing protein [Phormidesmis sp.]
MPDQPPLEGDEDLQKSGGSRIIGRLLPPAVRLWLRSQVEQVDRLSIELAGRDRQILRGNLPGVSVSAHQAIYEGIHISSVQLSAEDIRINIGQVVRGKPLRLLKSFPVSGEVLLSPADLNASLNSSMLAVGLTLFWQTLSQAPSVAQAIEDRHGPLALQSDMVLAAPTVKLGNGCLGLSFYPCVEGVLAEEPIVLGTKLTVASKQYLQLNSTVWLSQLDDLNRLADPSPVGEPIPSLEGFQWNLGQDTQLTQLDIRPHQLICAGTITVQP